MRKIAIFVVGIMLVTSYIGIFSIQQSVANPAPVIQTLIFGCAGDADKLDPGGHH